eukprot:7391903-Prymnesium_polylepis.1
MVPISTSLVPPGQIGKTQDQVPATCRDRPSRPNQTARFGSLKFPLLIKAASSSAPAPKRGRKSERLLGVGCSGYSRTVARMDAQMNAWMLRRSEAQIDARLFGCLDAQMLR